MRRFLILLLSAVLLLASAASGRAESEPAFLSITGLDAMQEALDAGASIASADYTEGLGFSVSEFRTEDPEETQALWDALRKLELAGVCGESVTDWYPQIVFTLSDGSRFSALFEAHWLSADGGRVNYHLTGDEDFWALTARLTAAYKEKAMNTIEMQIGSAVYDVALADSEAAAAFRSFLPMTLDMEELNGNEKYHYLSDSLPTDSYCPGTIEAGDIRLFGGSCVVLFYETFQTGYTYTDIGRVLSPEGLAEALGSGDAEVTFREKQ